VIIGDDQRLRALLVADPLVESPCCSCLPHPLDHDTRNSAP